MLYPGHGNCKCNRKTTNSKHTDLKTNIRDNLLITAGARAAYMECSRVIDLPSGVDGEEILAEFVTGVVDKYIDERINNPFDEYIENALKERFGIEIRAGINTSIPPEQIKEMIKKSMNWAEDKED